MEFYQALSNITKTSKSLTIFMAPLGWGKTKSVCGLLDYKEKIIFISPLRSIIEEISSRQNVLSFNDLENKEQTIKKFCEKKNSNILALTPESLEPKLLNKLLDKNFLFVFDEFHLFYDWGESFRPRLLDFFEEILFNHERILGLSASIDLHHKIKIEEAVANSFYKVFFLDVGNYKFNISPKNLKHCYFYLWQIKVLIYFYCLIYRDQKKIIFVKRRKDVFILQEKFRELGLRSSVCLGGQVRRFCAEEKVNESKIIISTSALSHGVNLHGVRHVFLLFKPQENIEFQMFGRGGRFGESFKVYGVKKLLFKENIANYAKALWIKLKASF